MSGSVGESECLSISRALPLSDSKTKKLLNQQLYNPKTLRLSDSTPQTLKSCPKIIPAAIETLRLSVDCDFPNLGILML